MLRWSRWSYGSSILFYTTKAYPKNGRGYFSRSSKGDLLLHSLDKENIEISGIYYYLLKKLAWKGINIVEVISTTNEFTIILNDADVEIVFNLLSQLKKDRK